MEDLIKVNMWMTKNKEMVNIHGQMEDFMMVIGRMVNNMGEVSMYYLMERWKMEFGIKAEEWIGWKNDWTWLIWLTN